MFLESGIFRFWLAAAALLWVFLFTHYNDLAFFVEHWFYPATMVLGAFVAGSTPEGGGAVAFPVLNIFLEIDRVLARDFSLMIQSVGMTSASIFILTNRNTRLRDFSSLLWFVPTAFVGFVFGMHVLQGIKVQIIQALFLSLIAGFAFAYYFSSHRGTADRCNVRNARDLLYTVFMLFLGGMCTSLFGTGADILIYTLLVTHFAVKEKIATEMSVILIASLSDLAYIYLGLYEGSLSRYQVQTWLCAYPVVLIMAPLGAYVLKRVSKEYMLRAVVLLNIAQLCYFNAHNPSLEKTLWSLGFTALLSTIFFVGMAKLVRRRGAAAASAEAARAAGGRRLESVVTGAGDAARQST